MSMTALQIFLAMSSKGSVEVCYYVWYFWVYDIVTVSLMTNANPAPPLEYIHWMGSCCFWDKNASDREMMNLTGEQQ